MKVVTIGAGYFAQFHVQSWIAMPQVTFAGLADFDTDKARALVSACGDRGAPVFQSATDMFAATEPDIIDIAAPPVAHLQLIRQACDTDARIIVCQKPFCASPSEAQTAVAYAQKCGKVVVVHENFRFQPWYRTIKDQIDAGALGSLHQVTFRLRPGDGQGPDAYLARQPYFQEMPRFLIHETGVHWIDTFRYLMGEPTSVMSDLRRLNPAIKGEDAGFFLFRYDDGRRALFDGNRLIDHDTDNTRLTMGEALVEGSDAMIRLDGQGRVSIRAKGAQGWSELDVAGRKDGFGGGCVDALQAHVVAHLTDGSALENTAQDYLRNIALEQAIYEAAKTGTAQPVAP